MTTVGWLVLGLCVVLTHLQIPVWSSDLALWHQAAYVSPLAPRAAVNLAAQYIHAGRWLEAQAWAHQAERLIRPSVRDRERDVVRKILDDQYAWIDAFSR